MKYWINDDSEHNNVVVFTEAAVLLGSIDKESIKNVNAQLAAKKNPLEVLGSDDLLTIPFAQIHSIESRDTDENISLRYKAKKGQEDQELEFTNKKIKQEAIKVFKLILPENLKHSITRQSAIAASISPLLSIAVAVYCTYLFIDKLRWPAIIIGGAWALMSVYMLHFRFSNPPNITRWTVKGKYARKTWHSIKTGFALLVVAVIISKVHRSFPDAYGEASLYQQIQFDEWQKEGVDFYVKRGADVNYLDEDGDSLIWNAVNNNELELVKQLIASGADPRFKNENGQSTLAMAVNQESQAILKALLDSPFEFKDLSEQFAEAVDYGIEIDLLEHFLKKGADINFQVSEGQNLLASAIQNSNDPELIKFLVDNGADTQITINNKSIADYVKDHDRTDLFELFNVMEDQTDESSDNDEDVEEI